VPRDFLRALRALCDEHGILLILDEIQCGMGRTGTLFAHEQAGITPDLMGVAKGIGGGFPLGACLATEDAATGMVAGSHGSTYGGNPLACAVGNAVMAEITAPGFLDDVKRKAGLVRQRLAELADAHPDIIAEIRGEGLMLGVRLHEGTVNGDFVTAGRANGLLTVPAGDNVVRILPPLNITDEDLAEGVARLDATCRAAKAATAA
jgi:acetylornithine/N-succinyldiaminopimelate aminotransferase